MSSTDPVSLQPSEPVPQTTDINTEDIISQVPDMTTQSDDATTEETTTEETTSTETQSEQKGPLSKLTEKAANSPLIRKVNDNVPSTAKAYLQKGKEPANKAIAAVDKTLQTNEAQRVARTTVDLLHALTAFTLLILTWTVTNLESTLQIEKSDDSTTSATTTEEQEQERSISAQQSEPDSKSELNRHKEEAIVLLKRYKTVARTLISKASAYAQERKSRQMNQQQQQEQEQQEPASTYDPYSIDKVVKDHAKKGVKLAKQVSAYSLSQASQFEGPGSSTIAPAADYIISKLPEDAKRAVKDSTSPFQ